MGDKEERLSKSLNAIGSKKSAAAKPNSGQALPNVAKRLRPGATTQTAASTEIKDELDVPLAFKFAFLGTGQGGGRIAQSFWDIGYRRIGAFNTTASDFEPLSDDMPRLSLDIGGAAKDMSFARKSLNGRQEEIWDLFTRGWGSSFERGMICASLGGGTGSGTVVPLLMLARQYAEEKGISPRIGCIVSLPALEGQIYARNAVMAFRELLAARPSPLIVIDNAKIQQLYAPAAAKLHWTANDAVAQLLHLFNRLAATRSQLATFDASEFGQLLDSGICVMGAADIPVERIKTPADVSTCMREQLASSILADVDVSRGRKAACVFVAGEQILDKFSIDYFDAGFQQLNRMVGASLEDKEQKPVIVHRGLYPSAEENIQCYTMIGELPPPLGRLQELGKTAGLPREGTSATALAKFLGVE